jgi:putative methyltransferase
LGQFLFCFAKGGIKIMGYVEMLESADKKMIVEEKGLKITEDALLLSNFLRKYFSKKNKNPKTRKSVILEIGAGQGIMSLLISEIDMVERIIAVEVQKDVYETLEKNIEINNLRQKITPLNENIKNIEGKYEFIFSNPPYKKVNAGKLPDNVTERISKYEILLTLEELFREIRRLLSNYGEFFVIVPNSRLNDVFRYIYANNMNIISIEINKYKKTDLIIVHGRKGGKANSGIVIDF